MRLSEIASLVGSDGHLSADPEITDLHYDSREVIPGSLFFCIPGDKVDRHDLANQAVSTGAAAVVAERDTGAPVPHLVTSDIRGVMNHVAAPFFGHPSREIKLVGVTGTNGKTTTTYMVESIARASGEKTGLVGTIERRVADSAYPAPIGTPESSDLQRLFRAMTRASVATCALEVTSIGISQGRIEGCDFDVAVFTNLSQDHLNFHGSMEEYYEAKRRLFLAERTPLSLINIDDQWGRRLTQEVTSKVLTYSVERDADLVAESVRAIPGGTKFLAVGMGMRLELEVLMPARFNVLNAIAAAGAARAVGLPEEAIRSGLSSLKGVPGRFERVDEGQDFMVVVDYAHTPDGLDNVLRFAREICLGELRVVFGCGGDRDSGKRPEMGRVAASIADRVYVTSDNPRSEEPSQIIDQILTGIIKAPPSGGYVAISDRAEAIQAAISESRSGDVVVIAGKGHETGQEFADTKIPFDDREVARAALQR
ncbi:MAG: UDP-N-acetylmuramoyl-L-alanyl-D-glutamate--2,6-diaminopimelate ligase [Actinobacteria bacterium]|nr:UDP-N-acetylmuramoyl-L-alanyl-D-glutamate--2,6-diaminopimelate ligase [Actinomycetota bacterium]